MKKIGKIITKPNVYISLWIIYNLQGTLYASGSIISQVILFILLLWGIVCFCRVLLIKNKPIFFKGLNLLLIVLSLYGIYLLMSGKQLFIAGSGYTKVRNIEYLKSILISLLPVYVIYYYSRITKFTHKHLSKWVLVFVFVAILQYIRTYKEVIAFSSSVEEITNNSGYLFVSLIPCFLVLKNKKILQYLVLAICGFFIISSMKRGAILIGIVTLIIYLFYNIRTSSKQEKWMVLILSSLVIIFAYYITLFMLDSSEYFISRINQTLEGDDSNRSIMYLNLLQTYLHDTSFTQMLFGRGAWSTLTVSLDFAHNDWLEILTNQGLIGVVIYIYYWVCFYFSSTIRSLNTDSKFVIKLLFFICFAKTLFSMSYSDMNIYMSSALGLALANGFDMSFKSGRLS